MSCLRYGKIDESASHTRDDSGLCVFCGDVNPDALPTLRTNVRCPSSKSGRHSMLPPPASYCVLCGYGAKKAEPTSEPKMRIESVACPIHGSHKIEIDEHGQFKLPECDTFTRHGGPV
jgi:hypothetical protein